MGDATGEALRLPVGQIAFNPDNTRDQLDQEALQELAESIKVHGLLQPITVRDHPTKKDR